MSDATLATAPAPRPLWVLTALSLALTFLCLIWAPFETRTLGEVAVWAKPLKFAVSFVVFFGTLALVEARLSPAARDTALARRTVTALTVAMIFEMSYILLQAARGEASHYNTGDIVHAVLYQLMAIGAVTLVVGAGLFGRVVARDTAARMGPGLRAGLVIGLPLSALLTLVTAFPLGAMDSHFVGTPLPGAATIPLFGWSASVGDLRPAHFLALHTMQALPLFGLALDRAGRGSRGAVILGAGVWSLFTLAIFAQGLAGIPLIRL